MKYLKKFNEELKPYTYRKAAAALKKMGHSRRASALTEWEEETRKREAIKARNKLKAKLEKTPPFSMKIFRDKWNSSTKSRDFSQDPYLEGNFYLGAYFEEEWAYDGEYFVEYEQDNKSTMQFSFGLSLFPADEETQLKFDKEEWEHEWNNQIWPVNFTIRLNNDRHGHKTTLDQEKSALFWEEREDGTCLFSSRSEAMKFKRYLIYSLSGVDNDFSEAFSGVKSIISNVIKRYNDKDDFYWIRVPKNVVGNGIVFDRDDYEIKKIHNNDYYWPFGDKECNLKESDYNYFEKAIKRMSLNNLYRD
jgi:hypothetical protein